MLKFGRLKISAIIIVFAYILTGCTGQPIQGMPTNISGEIDKLTGDQFNFGHLVIMDANTGKHTLLKRQEKDENGNLKYESRRITSSRPIKKVKNITSYSVHSVIVEDKKYSSCNIINIDNRIELICKKEGTENSEAHDQGGVLTESARTLKKGITSLITLPDNLVNKLKQLGGGKVNDIGFIIVQDIHGSKTKLLKSEGYETADLSLLDSAKELTSAFMSTTAFIEENPCCKEETNSSGTKVRTCDIFAPSC